MTTAPGADVLWSTPLVQRPIATDNGDERPGGESPTCCLTGFLTGFRRGTSVAAPARPQRKTFHAYVLRPTGTADQYSVVFDSGAAHRRPRRPGSEADLRGGNLAGPGR